MACVQVQVGQCGNQLGGVLQDVLFNQLDGEDGQASSGSRGFAEDVRKNVYFRENSTSSCWTARNILVDMETKVVGACLAQMGDRWKYDRKNAFVQQSGSGNNWAAGYCQARAGDAVLELVRQEVERSDTGVASFFMLQSLAGGTGSGLGARICELLQDTYGSEAKIVNGLVAPYSAGEVSVQEYNSLFTIAHASQLSDAVILLQNDLADAICRTRLRLKCPSFHDINSVMARHLACSFLLPSCHERAGSSSIGKQITHLCAHPSFRFLDIKMLPTAPSSDRSFDSQSWKALIRRLRQMQYSNSAMEDRIDWASSRNKTLAASLHLRGDDAEDGALVANEEWVTVPVASWRPKPLLVHMSSYKFDGWPRSAALISNSQSVLPPLQRIQSNAWSMWQAGAYVHQYGKYGLQEQDWKDALAMLDQIVLDYSNL